MRLIDVISIIISMKYSFLKHFLNFGPAYCMSAISVGVTSVPLVVVALIVRRDTVMIGMILVPVVCMNIELSVTIFQ